MLKSSLWSSAVRLGRMTQNVFFLLLSEQETREQSAALFFHPHPEGARGQKVEIASSGECESFVSKKVFFNWKKEL